MATRSTIAIELANGAVKQVYCHWDGYLEHNGKMLLENYSDPAKLEELINIGDISSLGTEVGVQHPFSSFECNMPLAEFEEKFGNMTTFYSRDRGETATLQFFNDFDAYRLNHAFEEYNYILRADGKWYFSLNEWLQYVPLTSEMFTEVA